MKKTIILFLALTSFIRIGCAQDARTVIDLNGTWEFDQTTTAFPPAEFTRTIPVPGLIHLAEPRIEEYNKFFRRADRAEAKEQYNLYNLDYTPKYSWYRKRISIPKELEGTKGIITIKKSQYVTQIFINGIDLGTSMACYTPVEFPVDKAIRYGSENEILIKVGERVWLPAEAAGGTDKEKEHYLPGIWDDVFISFTGDERINRLLVLPSVAGKNVVVKAQIRNLLPAQIFYGDQMVDTVKFEVSITEKGTGKEMAKGEKDFFARRDNIGEVAIEIPMTDFKAWSPESPFLYNATARLKNKSGYCDIVTRQFGMRDFNTKGKYFYLNGEKYMLRGTNITLQRFFEDPDCSNLVWDKEWVKKLLVNYPKQLNWNAMRICVGIVPDFWYDIADENGLLFQNEWLYWQNHGWDEEIRKEYTDWVWTDGSHPSIAIWDAINENTDEYIGNTLIPELKKLDPTRIWDAGYMREGLMKTDEMDEPHPYEGVVLFSKNINYPMGKLDYKSEAILSAEKAGVPQLVNEYGWIWLWRNGMPSKLTVSQYNYYLGPNSTVKDNRDFQAYDLQLESEWLRSDPAFAGVLAFCYLANNYGYTGDWFTGNIKDLTPSSTLDWFSSCFAPSAVFIDLSDGRYVKQAVPYTPGTRLKFNLADINDLPKEIKGSVSLRLYDSEGKTVSKKVMPVVLAAFDRSSFPVEISLPHKAGGYLITAEFTVENGTKPVISRRYFKVGTLSEYKFYDLQPGKLKN